MLKSTAPVQEEEEDPLAYYEKHTSQIEASSACPGGATGHRQPPGCSLCLLPASVAPEAFPPLCPQQQAGLRRWQSL